MQKEWRWALALLIVGLMAMGSYSLFQKKGSNGEKEVGGKEENKVVDSSDRKIIIPSSDRDVYRHIPEVKAYLDDLKVLHEQNKTILPLGSDELDRNGEIVQSIVLKNKKFTADTRMNGKILHNDMMRILPALKSSLDEKSRKVCSKHKCYQAEKYNFFTNTTTRAIVDLDDKKVLSVRRFPDMQPDISRRLTRIAKAIALNAPEISKEWGRKPAEHEMSMANVRTSLHNSPCENKNHLCVAPTFADHKKEEALWAIVDLTDLKLAAAKWAGLGKTFTPACIGERSLENRYIMQNFCQKDNRLKRDGWSFVYHLTGSDGLEIRNLSFHGKPAARSLKIVDWHVAYKGLGADKLDTSTPTFVEGRRIEYVKGENNEFTFGYNDAMGCPMFSTSVVLAFNGPQIRTIKDTNGSEIGFSISQDFRNPKWPMACNYRYENRFEFYKDGSFRVVAINLGRGCSNHAIYRPVMRIDTNLGGGKEQFSLYRKPDWKIWEKESDYRASSREALYKNRFLYRINVAGNIKDGFYIEPNRGQFGDKSRGDHEHIFATRFHPEEGDEDLLTLGSCCKLKEDGPERYLNGENINGKDIVLWYVPTIRNDDRPGHEYCWADSTIDENGNPSVKKWPCIVGPKFVPISNVEKK